MSPASPASVISPIAREHGQVDAHNPSVLKEAGNDAMRARDWKRGMHMFTVGIDMITDSSPPRDAAGWFALDVKSKGVLHLLCSNRSLAHLSLGDTSATIQDGGVLRGCNPMYPSCNPVYPRLQPYVSQACCRRPGFGGHRALAAGGGGRAAGGGAGLRAAGARAAQPSSENAGGAQPRRTCSQRRRSAPPGLGLGLGLGLTLATPSSLALA